MERYQVTILPENITAWVEKGTSLLAAAREAGIDMGSPCGGQGTCGKCAVKVVNGVMDVQQDAHMPKELKDEGYVPACRVQVHGDITVEVPSFSRLTRHEVVLSGQDTRDGGLNGYFSTHGMNPVSGKFYVELDQPGLLDCVNDLDRLLTALNKQHGIQASMGLACLKTLPDVIRNGDWKLTVTIADFDGKSEIVRLEPGRTDKPAYGLAVDLGTTTVAASLVDLENGRTVDRAGTYNRQAAYGSDVISRIIYTEEKPDGIGAMQKVAIDTLNGLIGELVLKNGIARDDISVLVLGGNTVMTHMFMGVSASYLRLEPYIPAAAAFPPVPAKELSIGINPDGPVITMPSVASYVGGDITAGVLATMLTHSGQLTLFIDVGTNGELVLGNNEWMVSCSCSAGPAFEGSGISCGMRAMDGAIDWIEIEGDSFEVRCRTIGNTKPVGICGSGLIYSLSEMMEAGIIDRAGQIMGEASSPRIRKGHEGMEYVLVFAQESGSGKDIVITESDIKNLLRAKGAIFAGIRTMLHEVQLSVEDIDRVYIAGGFGNYIHITDAIHIGMLPDLPEMKYEFVGNSCMQGAVLALLCREALAEALEISQKITYLELSVGNRFMDEFVSALFIPHTDLGLFPTAGKGVSSRKAYRGQ